MTDTPRDAHYFSERHGMNPPHSEVVEACATIPPCKALDMGCGSGRNALYLASLGFDVTAIDANPAAIGTLQSILEHEGMRNVAPRVYDINEAALGDDYDFIACTVTLMFLDPACIPAVIADMQACTRPGGYNLVVAAMDTPRHPCPVGFPFKLAEGELRDYYEDKGWELVKYNEDLGTLHSGARFQFATLLARKPA